MWSAGTCYALRGKLPVEHSRVLTISFLVVPSHINQSSAHMTLQPNVHSGQAIDPPRLKFLYSASYETLSSNPLNNRNLIVRSNYCRGFRNDSRLVHVVVNALHRFVDVIGEFSFRDLDVLPSADIGKMTAYERVEVVSKKLIKYLEVLMEICRDVKPLERSVARSYAVDRHLKNLA